MEHEKYDQTPKVKTSAMKIRVLATSPSFLSFPIAYCQDNSIIRARETKMLCIEWSVVNINVPEPI